MTLLSASWAGMRYDVSDDSPIAEATADRASRRGTPAAMSAPKATSRIASVTGRLKSSARWKSLPTVSLSPLLMEALPTSSTRRAGWSRCTAAVVSSNGCTRSSAVFGSPAMLTDSISMLPSGDGIGPSTFVTPGSARIRVAASSIVDFAAAVSSAPDRALTRTRSMDGSFGKFPSLISCSARAVSPTPPSPSACLVPTAPPIAIDAATNTTHSAMARQGCSALHRAIRTVNGLRSTVSIPSLPPVRRN